MGTDIGNVNIVGRGRETEIRDVYIFGGVVLCGRFGVRHITSGMLILGEVRVGRGGEVTGGLGVRGKIWPMGDAYIIKT